MTSALVIGAGVGGIAAAARLAQKGYRVMVVEKNEGPGGRCGQMEIEGHRLDTGPTLFIMPELYTRTFQDLGERMEDHLELLQVDPSYHIHFGDGTKFVLSSNLEVMRRQLEEIEPGSSHKFLRYLEQCRHNYLLSMPNLVTQEFNSLRDLLKPSNLLLFLRLRPLTKHYSEVGNYFSDRRLRFAFVFQDLYMGMNPYEAPAIFSLIQHSEFADGVWYPKGGMYRFVEALAAIARKSGVRFLYRAHVARIDVEGRKATGITLTDGRRLEADVVLANADLTYVYKSLLPDDISARRLERKKYSCSALLFMWGMDQTYPQLGAHNLFLADNLRENLEPLFDLQGLPDEPHFYVHAPTRMDSSMAPKGQDTLIIAIPSSHINDEAPQNWHNIQQKARRAVLRRLGESGLCDLEKHIKFEVSFTPLDWRKRLNLDKGSIHGLSHELSQMAYLRPHNRHSRYRNLYFVGASTHPGTGVPTVLVSARLAADRIQRDWSDGGSSPRMP